MTTNPMRAAFAALAAIVVASAGRAAEAQKPDSIAVDARARIVTHNRSVFGADPVYSDTAYDYQAQLDIYGAKRMNSTQRPLLELGRDLYDSGPFRRAGRLLGAHNVLIPQLLVYGDLRSAAGQSGGDADAGTWANRLNLEVDLRLTATERIHALFRPLEKDGAFTRYDFQGDSTGFRENFDGEPAALFFEGDVGAILGGLTGRDAPFDLPVAAGLMPLLFHNGVWVEDAFTGAAFTIPARNSRALGWSNYDITAFAGIDRVTTPGLGDGRDKGRIGGVNTFIEAYKGYIEAGYAYVMPDTGGLSDFHSVAFSFTRRYRGRVSNSVRYIGSFAAGDTATVPGAERGGHFISIENSLITSRPTTVVPYLNVFYGIDSPSSAARDAGAGGILKNTGLSFETDALTAFPALDATARDAVGGAFGLNLLGSGLNRQLVIEVAGVHPLTETLAMPGTQLAAGIRVQQVLNRAMLLRVDGMFGKREGLTNIRGVRGELRVKF